MKFLRAGLCLGSLAVLATGAWAQLSSDRQGFAPGVTDPTDSIVARRLVMTTLGRKNDQVHDILDRGEDTDLDRARNNLDDISVYLLAFPHMFEPEAHIYSPEQEETEPGTVSLSLPALWENWDDFYSRSLVASETAYTAGRAEDYAEVLRLTEELETQCESCHALYRKDQPPIIPPMLQVPAAVEQPAAAPGTSWNFNCPPADATAGGRCAPL